MTGSFGELLAVPKPGQCTGIGMELLVGGIEMTHPLQHIPGLLHQGIGFAFLGHQANQQAAQIGQNHFVVGEFLQGGSQQIGATGKTVGTDLAKGLEIPVTNVHVSMDYMGGGFGSKFPSDIWGMESAKASKESGGKPVKFFHNRADELTIAGVRPLSERWFSVLAQVPAQVLQG